MKASDILSLFREHMVKERPGSAGVLHLEEASPNNPDRINVFLSASSFEACQQMVFNVMERRGYATFTIPVKTADGQFCSVGHYPKPKDPLPEL